MTENVPVNYCHMMLSMCLVAIIVLTDCFCLKLYVLCLFIFYKHSVSSSVPKEQAVFASTGNENSKRNQWGMKLTISTVGNIENK